VIRYLHHSTKTEDIKQELAELAHGTKNIINVHHKATKEPFNLFFVDLEPAHNNRKVYEITELQNRIVKIEPPHSNKTNIIQCTRCQQYGHTKSYCNMPYICVKFGGPHNTIDCRKTRETSARCALCGGDHPANYRGCEHYRKLAKGNNKNILQRHATPPTYTNECYVRNMQPCEMAQPRSYAEVTKRNFPQTEDTMSITRKFYQRSSTPENNINDRYARNIQSKEMAQPRHNAEMTKHNLPQPEDTTNILTKFLDKLKNLIQQLLQQNTKVLNMLTTLVNKMN
jgi:hypothetical protein